MRLPAACYAGARLAVAQMYAGELRAYIERRAARGSGVRPEVTVAELCRRFRLTIPDLLECIMASSDLVVSSYAYLPPPKTANWSTVLIYSFVPALAPDAPVGRRIVMVIDFDEEKPE